MAYVPKNRIRAIRPEHRTPREQNSLSGLLVPFNIPSSQNSRGSNVAFCKSCHRYKIPGFRWLHIPCLKYVLQRMDYTYCENCLPQEELIPDPRF